MATIKHKRSSVSGNSPTSAQLDIGEIAVNFSDKTIFTKNASGVVIELGRGSSDLLINNFTGDGSTVAFTLSSATLENATLVYIDGVYQHKNTYAVSSAQPSVLTFSEAPPSSSAVEIMVAKISALGEAADGSITTAKVANGAITSDKIDSTVATTASVNLKADLAGATFTGEIVANAGIALGDNDKATFGAGDDLQLYHDGSNSYIKDAGTGSLLLLGQNLHLRDTSGYDFINCTDTGNGGTVALFHEGSSKLSTTSTGIDVTGTATMDGLTVDGTVTSTDNIFMSTNGSVLRNTGGALQLQSDTSQVILKSNNTTALTLDVSQNATFAGTATMDGDIIANSFLRLRTIDDQASQWYVYNNIDDTLRFNFNGSGNDELVIDSSGNATFSGTATMDGLVVDGEGRIEETGAAARFVVSRTDALNTAATASVDLLEGSAGGSFGSADNYGFSIDLDGSANTLNILSGNQTTVAKRLSVARDTGDISFYEDTGTTAKFLWDASAEKLNLSGTGGLDVTGTATMGGLSVQSTSASATVASFKGSSAFGIELAASAVAPYIQTVAVGSGEELAVTSGGNKVALFQDGGDISFYEDTGTTPKFLWDASAESLGIGTDSPSYKADILSTNQNALRLNTTDANGCFLAIQTNGTAKGYLGSSHHLVTGTPSEDDITLRAENNLQFTTNGGAEAMRIDASGNVGIGVAPVAAGFDRVLHLHGTNQSMMRFTGSTYGTGADDGAYVGMSYGGFEIDNRRNTYTRFSTNGSERMRIDSSGTLILSGNGGSATNSVDISYNGSSGQGSFNADSSGGNTFLTFGTSSSGSLSERMRIDSSGNVGIGTDSPSMKVNISHGDQDGLRFNTSNTAESFIDFGDTDDNDIGRVSYDHADNSMAFRTNNQERLRIDSSGNVGIGTSSPSTKLEIRNDVNATTDLDPTAIKLYNNSDGGSAIEFSNSVAGKSKISFGVTSNGSGTDDTYLGFSTGANASLSEAMRIDSAGNVGIGTSPTSKLHLYKTGTSDNTLSIQNGQDAYASVLALTANNDGGASYNAITSSTSGASQHWKIWGGGSANTMAFSTNGSEHMRIDSAGNLLVGKPSANSFSTAGTEIYSSGLVNMTGPDNQGVLFINRKGSDGDIAEFYKNGTSVGSIGTANADALTIGNSTGNLILYASTVAPCSNSSGGSSDGVVSLGTAVRRFKDLYLSGTVTTGNVLVGATSGTGDKIVCVATGSERNLLMKCPNGGANAVTLNTSGTADYSAFVFTTDAGSTQTGGIVVRATSTAFNTSSDYRLKDITGPLQGSGDYIDSLKPVEGTWKSDGSVFVGLLAHEADEVSRTKIATGEKDGEEMQGMDYSSSEMIANLIKEVQSLRNRVAQLEGS